MLHTTTLVARVCSPCPKRTRHGLKTRATGQPTRLDEEVHSAVTASASRARTRSFTIGRAMVTVTGAGA